VSGIAEAPKKAISVIVLPCKRGFAKSFLHCSKRRVRMQSPSVQLAFEKRRSKWRTEISAAAAIFAGPSPGSDKWSLMNL